MTDYQHLRPVPPLRTPFPPIGLGVYTHPAPTPPTPDPEWIAHLEACLVDRMANVLDNMVADLNKIADDTDEIDVAANLLAEAIEVLDTWAEKHGA